MTQSTLLQKRLRWMIIALMVIFGGIVAFNLFKAFMIKRFFASYEPPAVSVSATKVQEKNWQPKLSAVGNFVAINGVEVNSEASGNVVKLYFNSGQFIEKGQPLIDIDDTVEQATLKFNQAQLSLRTLDFQRQSNLSKKGAAALSVVDEAKANLDQAQAQVEKIQAQIEQKHILAPFSGRLGIRQVNLGQYISPGQTSVVTLQSLDPLYLEFYLPEQLLNRLAVNQSIQVAADEWPNLLFKGTISAINSKIDTNTHNILVQATVPNCSAALVKKDSYPKEAITIALSGDKRLLACNSDYNRQNRIQDFIFIPGMFATIKVNQPVVSHTLIVPSTAISYSLYGDSVFVIENIPASNNKKAKLQVKRKFVKTGPQEENFTVIEKGLQKGQLIVSSGELKLQDGTAVVINNSVKLHPQVNLETLSE